MFYKSWLRAKAWRIASAFPSAFPKLNTEKERRCAAPDSCADNIMSNEPKTTVETEEKTYYHGGKAVARKFAFASGELVYNLPWMLVSSYLAFFMTDVALIPASAVSILFLICRIWDAINDPMIGSLADRTNTKMGRYRPWMLGGAIGLICAMVCKSKGGIPVVADPIDSRLETAKSMGVEYVCNNAKEDLVEYLKRINNGHLANRMYECSGATPVQQNMFDYVESAGTIVMVGWPHAIFEMDMAKVIRKALTIVGSRNASDSFPEAIQLVADKVVDSDKFVTSVVPIEQTLEVLQDMVDHPANHLKTLIRIRNK